MGWIYLCELKKEDNRNHKWYIELEKTLDRFYFSLVDNLTEQIRSMIANVISVHEPVGAMCRINYLIKKLSEYGNVELIDTIKTENYEWPVLKLSGNFKEVYFIKQYNKLMNYISMAVTPETIQDSKVTLEIWNILNPLDVYFSTIHIDSYYVDTTIFSLNKAIKQLGNTKESYIEVYQAYYFN